MQESNSPKEKLAAGGIVLRDMGSASARVLLVHRPEYGDWSYPKGGVEGDESLEDAALREVREETGITARILRKLSISRYDYRTRRGGIRPKAVHYFLMEPLTAEIKVDGHEVDHADWFELAEAMGKLSYADDLETLAALLVPKT